MKISVNCASGIESVTKKELANLGYGDNPAINGRFFLDGDVSDIAKLNINLRTAERVMVVVGSFRAETFDELFDGTKVCEWERFISVRGRIVVKGKSVKSKLFALSACQKIIKKAIAERFREKKGVSSLPEDGEDYTVEFSLFEDNVYLSLDTSGDALHKRGYRDLSVPAPIKETLAAAMVLLSGKRQGERLYDIFCGSGTIPIEAVMIERNIPVGLHRSFAYEKWMGFDNGETKDQREKGKDCIKKSEGKIFYAADIDSSAVSMAVRHAKRAGVYGDIEFACDDMRKFRATEGIIVSNLPYGERLMNSKEIIGVYSDFGRAYKLCRNTGLCALTGSKAFERYFGKIADRKRKLYNADIECFLYMYFVKEGAKNGKSEDR